ncbi:hypothetical protein ES332_D12G192100v1 [Gossypium tomentosum]|uniref:Uncharacterized protein n=1 Tax=Gossypium tomentosum TaxID=34277 RepID=A0A5D2IC19_GOSTO|nr:hypothetical protein ES332_D12G192100v1 [Gossypium tomentosum]
MGLFFLLFCCWAATYGLPGSGPLLMSCWALVCCYWAEAAGLLHWACCWTASFFFFFLLLSFFFSAASFSILVFFLG